MSSTSASIVSRFPQKRSACMRSDVCQSSDMSSVRTVVALHSAESSAIISRFPEKRRGCITGSAAQPAIYLPLTELTARSARMAKLKQTHFGTWEFVKVKVEAHSAAREEDVVAQPVTGSLTRVLKHGDDNDGVAQPVKGSSPSVVKRCKVELTPQVLHSADTTQLEVQTAVVIGP